MNTNKALAAVALLAALAAPAHAQVRVFNPATGQSVNVSAASPTSSLGGLHMGSTPAPTQGGLTLLPRETFPATPPAQSSTNAPPRTAPAPQPQLLSPAKTAPQTAVPQFGKLGSVMVLVPLTPSSAEVANLKKVLETKDLTVTPFFHGGTAVQIVNINPHTLAALPQGTEMSVDIDNARAKALGIPGNQATIVYRDPSGAVRTYKLVSEYAAFQNQLDRLRLQGSGNAR